MGRSLVLELQQLAQTGGTPLSEVLRRAKVVAVKLNVDEARTWIEQEMDGYPDGVILPPYRVVPCELRGLNIVRGQWMPVRWDEADVMTKYFACGLMLEPIAQIEEYAKGKAVQQAGLPQQDIDILVQLGNGHLVNRPLARFYGRSSFVAILDAVRNKILDWSLALEKRGVRGEGMTFDDSEKANAAQIGFKIGPSARVLFLSANPDPASPLNVEKQENRIAKVRNGSKHQSNIHIESLPDLDLPEFAKTLRLHEPQIVHFSGRGRSDGALVMRDENGAIHAMQPKGLAKLIGLQKDSIRLVVLNACYSNRLAELLAKEIDCVLGMTDEVSDGAATLFAQAFYSALFDGKSIADAFATSAAVLAAKYQDEGDVPVLKVKPGIDAKTLRLVE